MIKRNDNVQHFHHAGYRSPLSILQNISENFGRFTLLVSTSVFVYGTSLVILLKYFGADLQRRNDKFERTILVNLRIAVLDLGRGFQC